MAEKKQQKELIVLAVLVVAAAGVGYLYFGPQGRGGIGISANGLYQPIKAEDFGKVLTGLETAKNTEYKSAGRNIFVMGALPVESTAGPAKVADPFRPQGPMPPPPPPPADLPMVFFGYGTVPIGGRRQAFLKEQGGDDARIYIVSEGDLVLNHIKILHIGNERIDFEDINTGQKGSKSLEAAPAA